MSNNDYDTLKNQVNLLSFSESFLNLTSKKIGDNKYRLSPCPFCSHNDCFTIFSSSQSFKCFSCDATGDIFNLICKVQNLSSNYEALKFLAEKENYKLKDSKINKEQSELYKKKLSIFNLAESFYIDNLKNSKRAKKYLFEQRKRSKEIVEKQRYGFAIKTKSLFKFLIEKGCKEQDILNSGLCRKNKSGKIYDLFKDNLIIYPLYKNSKISSFHAKAIDKKAKVKGYSLPNEYILHNVAFYGEDSLYSDEVIIVEGPEDKNAILQADNSLSVIAILGQLSEKQIEVLKKRTEGKTIYSCFDNDEAGNKYFEKILKNLSCQSNIYKINLPKTQDIDEVLKKYKSDKLKSIFKGFLSTANEGIGFYIEEKTEVFDDLDINEKTTVLKDVCSLVATLKEPFKQSQFIDQIKTITKAKKSDIQTLVGIVDISTKGELDNEDVEKLKKKQPVYRLKTNRYFKASGENNITHISSFVLDIKGYIQYDEESQSYLLTAKNYRNEVLGTHEFTSEQRTNVFSFNTALSNLASGFYFSGTQQDLLNMWMLEEERASIKHKDHYYRHIGYIEKQKHWLFADCIIGENGELIKADKEGKIKKEGIGYKIKDVNIYGGNLPYLCPALEQKEFNIKEYINLFWQMFDNKRDEKEPVSFRGYTALGFIASCVYLDVIVKEFGYFPFLFCFGPSESGKSAAVGLLMSIFGFHQAGEDWIESTASGMAAAMEQLSRVPFWLDEYSNTAKTDRNTAKKLQLLKDLFNRVGGGKDSPSGKRQIKKVNSALILSGQDRPEERAFLSRFVVISKDKPSETGTRAYIKLKANREKLPYLLHYLIKKRTKENENIFKAKLYEIKEIIKEQAGQEISDRTANLLAMVGAGFFLFNVEDNSQKFIDYLIEEAEKDKQRKEAEDVIFKFFNDIELLNSYNNNKSSIIKFKGTELSLYFNKVHSEWEKLCRETSSKEYLSKNAMLEYFERAEEGYLIKKESVCRLGGQSTRVIVLDITKLPQNIRKIVNVWEAVDTL